MFLEQAPPHPQSQQPSKGGATESSKGGTGRRGQSLPHCSQTMAHGQCKAALPRPDCFINLKGQEKRSRDNLSTVVAQQLTFPGHAVWKRMVKGPMLCLPPLFRGGGFKSGSQQVHRSVKLFPPPLPKLASRIIAGLGWVGTHPPTPTHCPSRRVSWVG